MQKRKRDILAKFDRIVSTNPEAERFNLLNQLTTTEKLFLCAAMTDIDLDFKESIVWKLFSIIGDSNPRIKHNRHLVRIDEMRPVATRKNTLEIIKTEAEDFKSMFDFIRFLGSNGVNITLEDELEVAMLAPSAELGLLTEEDFEGVKFEGLALLFLEQIFKILRKDFNAWSELINNEVKKNELN